MWEIVSNRALVVRLWGVSSKPCRWTWVWHKVTCSCWWHKIHPQNGLQVSRGSAALPDPKYSETRNSHTCQLDLLKNVIKRSTRHPPPTPMKSHLSLVSRRQSHRGRLLPWRLTCVSPVLRISWKTDLPVLSTIVAESKA